METLAAVRRMTERPYDLLCAGTASGSAHVSFELPQLTVCFHNAKL